MDKIGSILKQKRLELGLTIDEVSDKTRLTTKHLKAIEEGDISYFKDDLSYLRFFLKSYCTVLGLDFDEMKEELRLSIDDYTTSFTTKTVAQHEAIERGVKENVEKLRQPTQNTKKKKIKKTAKRKKPDMSLVSFLAIVIVIIIALIFGFVIFIQNNASKDGETEIVQPPVLEVPTYTKDPEVIPPVETPKDPVKKDMVITAVSDLEYTLENLAKDEDIVVKMKMGSTTSLRVLVNDKQLNDPVARTYAYKEEAIVREKAEKDKKIVFVVGFMQNNSIEVNGQMIPLPASVVNKAGTCVIQLNVKGE